MQQDWIYHCEISNYEALLLYNALKRHKDTFCYHPIAVAKREETGMKYHFLCIAEPTSIHCGNTHFVDIELYKPMAGMPYITRMKKLNFEGLLY